MHFSLVIDGLLQSRFFAICGFGNLPGDVTFYDKKADGKCKIMSQVRYILDICACKCNNPTVSSALQTASHRVARTAFGLGLAAMTGPKTCLQTATAVGQKVVAGMQPCNCKSMWRAGLMWR